MYCRGCCCSRWRGWSYGCFFLGWQFPGALPLGVQWQALWLNASPFILPYLVFLAWTVRPLAAWSLTAALASLIFLVNAQKMLHLQQPLLVADLFAWPVLSRHLGLLQHYLPPVWPGLLPALCLLLAGVALWREKPQWRGCRWVRAGLGGVLLVVAVQPWSMGWVNRFYALPDGSRPWEPEWQVAHFGLIRTLVHTLSRHYSPLPQVDEAALKTILAQPAKRLLGQGHGLPPVDNVVILLSESYFDPAILRGVEDGQYDVASWQALMERGLQGRMTVPTYGGATLRTEFELLTGVSLEWFPDHWFPFITLMLEPKPSLVWELRKAGYSTRAVHPNKAEFWNRHHAYPFLGFDHFDDMRRAFRENQRRGWYVGDDALVAVIRGRLRDTGRQLLYAVSMENHGPWHRPRPNIDERTRLNWEKRLPGGMPATARMELAQYIWVRRNAQRSLMELVQWLDARPQRTVVLFFGDHLPGLGQAFAHLGFDDGRQAYEQLTPFWFYDTHRDLSRLSDVLPVGKGRPPVDVEWLGSMLLDLVLDELPRFHRQHLRLALEEGQGAEALKPLQLARFHDHPLLRDAAGE